MYAQVIINFAKTQEIDRLFTYSVPYTLLPKVQIGSRVKVPFGQGNHTQIGYVIHLSSNPPEEHYRIKPIVSLFDEIPVFNEEQIEIAKFLVNYYGCSFAMALEVMLPPGMSKKPYSSFEEAETYITLNIKPEVLKSYIASKAHMKSFNKQRAILMLFLIQASISLEDLKKSNEVSPSSLSTLIKNGILRKEEKLIGFRKDPIHYEYFKKLNLEQTYAKDQLLAAIGANRYEGVLLQGITGSGKTEVFLYAICKVLEEGGSAIVLVPEIALTRQTLMRFKERFGNVVALTHSRMNQTERLRLYEQVRKGQIKVVIGPRSAVFMPMQNLKLIVVDEEHETTYKSETTPKYHAIDVARMRMIRNRGVLILASATPSLESYYEMKRDRLKLIELTQRVGNATLPEIEIVDMRKELKNGNMQIMSHTLHEAIERTVRAGNQVMLLLNRRGHSTFVNCRSCGFVVKCKHCDIAMTYHRQSSSLECHYCGLKEPIPSMCPACGSKHIRFFGSGTEKVEEYLNKHFKPYGIGRMDFDTTTGKEGHNKVLEAFQNHEFNILVGTQMIAKGHDFKDVTLVGIIAADQALYIQDFRSEERTYQLITQALGRAGRGDKKGEVVIQTYNPEHFVLEKIKFRQQQAFYEEELKIRKMLGYPPYTHLFSLTVLGRNEKEVIQMVHTLKYYYEYYNKKGLFRIVGPSAAAISRIADEYRWQLILVGEDREKLLLYGKYCLNKFINRENTGTIKINWDIDPISMF
ncbi:MAG: primosomal protein N' [Zhenhengia sp.]|jgi:primosomal protein N' (replication factor Y)|uniref:replication restart helicase PriA n=1 Tax=Zhenhengia sp. TaxID=2944208 RepID=UPI0015A79E79|nr:primosomal protein N' [Niameybacter sp.]MDU6854072.1 primosomal protein N' [Clostridiales bacterium]MDU6974214.1 primosomal protein N' [Clostridiales bacterium]